MDLWVLIVGLAMLVVALPLAGRRVFFLFRLITTGQPAPDRLQNVTAGLGTAIKTQVVEVFAQKKLLKWSVPGAAHFFVFWAFLILGSVYLEAFGILFSRNAEWAIPVVGHWSVLGFAQDFIAVMALVGIATFAAIRLRENPAKLGRKSRFSGSHLGGAWLILFMIFNVIWTMFLFRGASVAGENFPYGNAAFASHGVGAILEPLPEGATETLEGIGLLLHIGVMLAFLVIVLNSKHLHIFVAPLNVLFGRRPKALGAVKPLTSEGKPVTLDDIEDMDESTTLGIGSIEEFSWKGMLDFASCTECGRCQSQCPAWNTGKPLSPKLLIMSLRDHAHAKAPYLLAGGGKTAEGEEKASEEQLAGVPAAALAEAERPLIGTLEENGVIDPDVLWSCTTCGACVEQCPVDIEHVDHIVDMRRYQVMIESAFPSEAGTMLKNLEKKGNPWGLAKKQRLEWTKEVDFEVPVVGKDIEDLSEVEYLYWVGCAGALEDRAKKTTKAFAELLHMAGVKFAIMGGDEKCTGDSARRLGNEPLFQELGMENVAALNMAFGESLNEEGEVDESTKKPKSSKKIVATCPHCLNTIGNEYPQLGGDYEVIHHTQLLQHLVDEGKLVPVTPVEGIITYHDPCYLGRHNKIYTPPREIIANVPGLRNEEMHRHKERGFCCGAGGARMWMEERIGKRINNERVDEALSLNPDIVSTACPFCLVMLTDSVNGKKNEGKAKESITVVDVAQLLLESVKTPVDPEDAAETESEPEPEPVK